MLIFIALLTAFLHPLYRRTRTATSCGAKSVADSNVSYNSRKLAGPKTAFFNQDPDPLASSAGSGASSVLSGMTSRLTSQTSIPGDSNSALPGAALDPLIASGDQGLKEEAGGDGLLGEDPSLRMNLVK